MPNLLNSLRARFHERLAMNSFVVSDFPRAERHLETVVRLCPERPGVHYNLGLVRMATKTYPSAEASLRQELTRQPGAVHVLRALADLAFLRGDRLTARDAYRQVAPKISQGKERALVELRIRLCDDEGRFAGAMEAAVRFEEGCARMQSGQHADAVQAFEETLKGDPTHFLAFNNLGVIAMNIDRDYSRAQTCFSQADALIDHPLVKGNLKKLAQHTGKG